MTLHNIPEGMAVGLSFARAAQHTGNAVRELLLRTELRHAALFAVSDTLRIERCSEDVYKRQGHGGEPPELKHLSRARKRNQPRFR